MSSFHVIISHILTCADCANHESLNERLKDYRRAQNSVDYVSESELETLRSIITYYAAVNHSPEMGTYKYSDN